MIRFTVGDAKSFFTSTVLSVYTVHCTQSVVRWCGGVGNVYRLLDRQNVTALMNGRPLGLGWFMDYYCTVIHVQYRTLYTTARRIARKVYCTSLYTVWFCRGKKENLSGKRRSFATLLSRRKRLSINYGVYFYDL